MPNKAIKVILVGPCGTGKTAIKNALIGEEFTEEYKHTQLIEFSRHTIQETIVTIWDTSGTPLPQLFQETDAVVFVVDSTQPLSNYQEWLTEASQDHSKRCTGCPYYMSHTRRAATSVEDQCGLLHTACRNVVKDEETGICHKSTFDWDHLRDDSYKGTIMTSQISFT